MSQEEKEREVARTNEEVARPEPKGHGVEHEPTEEGFVAGLTRAPATPQRRHVGETRASLEETPEEQPRE